MILARQYVPAAGHDTEPAWSPAILHLNDERELNTQPEGTIWLIYTETKARAKLEPQFDTEDDPPSSYTFDRCVIVPPKPVAPTPSLKTLKKL